MPENAAFAQIATDRDMCRAVFAASPPVVPAHHLVGAAAKRDAASSAAFARRSDAATACLRAETRRRNRTSPTLS